MDVKLEVSSFDGDITLIDVQYKRIFPLLSHGLARLSIESTANGIKTSIPELSIKCFHDCPELEESSAFIFYSNKKTLERFSVGNTVLHTVRSQWQRLKAALCQATGYRFQRLKLSADSLRWITGLRIGNSNLSSKGSPVLKRIEWSHLFPSPDCDLIQWVTPGTSSYDLLLLFIPFWHLYGQHEIVLHR